jgi:D-sedoheptulose 7-phosphate isomerase
MISKLEEYLLESQRAYTYVTKQASEIESMAQLIWKRVAKGGTVYWMGNGGSAGDAQHLATELVSKFQLERTPLKSIALTTNTSLITAIANDYDFSEIFSRQVSAAVDNDDVLIGISTSGRSKNVVNAQKVGRAAGALTIAFTGLQESVLDEVSEYSLKAPSNVTGVIQQCHILYGQAICMLVEAYSVGQSND